MKKNASGFTLIELLAVIVVLAIVILMASMAIIPRMNEARKQVFSMESNEAINAASSYWLDGAIMAVIHYQLEQILNVSILKR